MPSPLPVLLVTDLEHARLVERELRAADSALEYERADTPGRLVQALRRGAWRLAICQPNLPQLRLELAMTLLLECERDVVLIASEPGTAPTTLGSDRYEEILAERGVLLCSRADLLAVAAPVLKRIRRRQELERAKALSSEERCLGVLDRVPEFVYAHDSEGRFTFVNRTAERIGGYGPGDLIGRNFSEVVAPDHLELARRGRTDESAADEPTIYEIDIVTKSGERVPVEIMSWLILRDGVARGVYGVARPLHPQPADVALHSDEPRLDSHTVAPAEPVRAAKSEPR